MAQEMTFAQALSEARQIIVQQSSRIKGDLDKIMALQDTIAAQSTTISQNDRTVREQADTLAELEEQIASVSAQLEEMTVAPFPGRGRHRPPGPTLTQRLASIEAMESQIAEQSDKIDQLQSELDGVRQQLPREDTDALAALSDLLANKKVSVPSATPKRNSLGEIRAAHHAADQGRLSFSHRIPLNLPPPTLRRGAVAFAFAPPSPPRPLAAPPRRGTLPTLNPEPPGG